MITSNLFGALTLAVYVSYLAKADLTRLQKYYVGPMVGGMLVAWLPYIIASTVGAETDPGI